MAKSRARRDWVWPVLLAVAILLILPTILTAIYAGYTQQKHWQFISALSNSTFYANCNDGLTVRDLDGSTAVVTESDDVYYFYRAMSVYGRGRPHRRTPESGASIKLIYGDGSWVQLWDVTVSGSRLNRENGLFVCYTDKSGAQYCFDTDMLTLEQVRNAILY